MKALPFLLAYLFLVPRDAHAYLDPGSGSLVFQVILAFFVSAGFVLKTNWLRVKNVFTKTSPAKEIEQEDDSETHE